MNIVQWLLAIYTFASTPATSYVFSPKSLLEHVVTESSLVRIICNVFFIYTNQTCMIVLALFLSINYLGRA